MLVQRNARLDGLGPRKGDGHREDGVGPEPGLVRSAIQLDEGRVARTLVRELSPRSAAAISPFTANAAFRQPNPP